MTTTPTKAPNLDWETTSRVLSGDRLFQPSQQVVENANITAYMRAKGFTTYDQRLNVLPPSIV